MKGFRGKVAVITGASGGIGEAIAIQLAREGTRLVLSGRNGEALGLVAERARDLTPTVETFAADLAEDEQVRALAGRALAAFGGVDILIHSIGLFLGGSLATSPVEGLDRQHRINVHANINRMRFETLCFRGGDESKPRSSSGMGANPLLGPTQIAGESNGITIPEL